MIEESISLLGQDLDDGEQGGEQYLTFLLNDEQYAVSILQVQEIRGWEQVTRIPNSSDYVRGVVNLRGNIVPVFDLRLRFGLPEMTYSKETVVIVVRTGFPGQQCSMGLVVDAVSDVLVVQREAITKTPEFGVSVPTENIKGLVADRGGMVMILDLPSLAIRSAPESDQDVA